MFRLFVKVAFFLSPPLVVGSLGRLGPSRHGRVSFLVGQSRGSVPYLSPRGPTGSARRAFAGARRLADLRAHTWEVGPTVKVTDGFHLKTWVWVALRATLSHQTAVVSTVGTAVHVLRRDWSTYRIVTLQ